MKKERIEWVDVSKGIGIILVIISHCVYLGNFAHNWIFSFHMPLFFILSGIFFRKASMLQVIKKKFQQLIIPYIVFCIIGLLITLLIPSLRHFTIKDIAREIYWGYPNSFSVSSIWFLICLFIVFVLFNAIILIYDKKKNIAVLLFATIVIFGFVLGRFPTFLAAFPAGRMPLDSDCACVALLFFGMGYTFRHKIIHLIGQLENNKLFIQLVASLCALLVTVVITITNGTVNLHGITYHNELLYIIGAIAGFVFIAFLSILAQNVEVIKSILIWFGRNSLNIMGTQAIAIRLYVLGVNSITGRDYQLFFLPTNYAIIGCFVVTLLSAGAVWVFSYSKKYIHFKN